MSNWTTRALVHFVNGDVYFLGIALSVLACALGIIFQRAPVRSALRMVAFVGALLVILSATPAPVWVYLAFFILLSTTWLVSGARPPRRAAYAYGLLGLLIIQSVTMVCLEIPHHLRPTISKPETDTLYVVGDSLTLGADPPGKNWPYLLGEHEGLKVRSYSFGGAKVKTALSNARRIDRDKAFVILEIGGNDILGGTPIPDFVASLDEMLALVCRSGRRVVMIELPLPPFHNRYGMVQRSLAKQYGVPLIPKRYLANVLGTPGATTDGLHLSNAGHALLANALLDLLDNTPSGPIETPSR